MALGRVPVVAMALGRVGMALGRVKLSANPILVMCKDTLRVILPLVMQLMMLTSWIYIPMTRLGATLSTI